MAAPGKMPGIIGEHHVATQVEELRLLSELINAIVVTQWSLAQHSGQVSAARCACVHDRKHIARCRTGQVPDIMRVRGTHPYAQLVFSVLKLTCRLS
jgi:hypothetical protein